MDLEAWQTTADYFTATEFGDDCVTPYEPIFLLFFFFSQLSVRVLERKFYNNFL
jgi:hypothetical protein